MIQQPYSLRIASLTPYSPSKRHDAPKQGKESPSAYEARTWRERMHVNADGLVVIPGIALKKVLEAAGKHEMESIQGRGKKQYTSYFKTDIIVTEDLVTNVRAEDAMCTKLYLDSQGGTSGKQVLKYFPILHQWEATCVFGVLDGPLEKKVLERYLALAGVVGGFGRWRPEKSGGCNGMFRVVAFEEV